LKKVAITIDVETDWGGRLSAKPENCQGIEKAIPFMLSLFDEFGVKATFFISCEILSLYGDVIRKIADNGHEIASHGVKHDICYDKMSRYELIEQIGVSKELLKDVTGTKPVGFRTPQFRINEYLYDILREMNFKYDSSMVKGHLLMRYNNKNIHEGPFIRNGICEIPISTLPIIKIPNGLLWINALGFENFKLFFDKFEKDNTTVFYLHPFDLIEDKSKINCNFIINNWYHYRAKNVRTTMRELLNYLNKNYHFLRLAEIAR